MLGHRLVPLIGSLCLLCSLCAIGALGAAAAQDFALDRPGRAATAPATPDPVVVPRPLPPDPGRAVIEAFHRSLDGDGADAARRTRLARARRVADFDLAWGLD